jgi:hypothetical protein
MTISRRHCAQRLAIEKREQILVQPLIRHWREVHAVHRRRTRGRMWRSSALTRRSSFRSSTGTVLVLAPSVRSQSLKATTCSNRLGRRSSRRLTKSLAPCHQPWLRVGGTTVAITGCKPRACRSSIHPRYIRRYVGKSPGKWKARTVHRHAASYARMHRNYTRVKLNAFLPETSNNVVGDPVLRIGDNDAHADL